MAVLFSKGMLSRSSVMAAFAIENWDGPYLLADLVQHAPVNVFQRLYPVFLFRFARIAGSLKCIILSGLMVCIIISGRVSFHSGFLIFWGEGISSLTVISFIGFFLCWVLPVAFQEFSFLSSSGGSLGFLLPVFLLGFLLLESLEVYKNRWKMISASSVAFSLVVLDAFL